MRATSLPERRAICAMAVLVGPMKAAKVAGVSHSTLYQWAWALGMTFPRRGMDGSMKHRPPKRCRGCGKR